MQAKREALEAVWRKEQQAMSLKAKTGEPMQDYAAAPTTVRPVEGQSPQKSLQGSKNGGGRRCGGAAKALLI